MHAYSLDLRRRVVRAYEQGHDSIAEIAEQFSVSTSFVKKMLRQWSASGDLSPLPHGGGKPASLSVQAQQKLRGKVREQSDLTLAELQVFLVTEQETSVHPATISRALKRLGLSRQKKAWSPVSATITSAPGFGDASGD